MIGRLHGKLLEKHPPQLLIDVGGVGYEVEAPMSTIFELPAVGQPVTLFTHLQVREDAHTLFGFFSAAERRLFRELIRISGIGAKMALAILSGIGPDEFLAVIQTADRDRLTKVPGVGKKTAERLLVELRDRSEQIDLGGGPASNRGAARPTDEAAQALVALGYSTAETQRLIKAVDTPDAEAEDLIRLALKKALK